MVNKTRKVFEQSLPEEASYSREVRQRGCMGCHSRCSDFAGSPGQKFGKGELDPSALATAIIHTIGIPLLLSTTLVGSAAAAGFGDGTQLVALVLGLASGTLFCKPVSSLVFRH